MQTIIDDRRSIYIHRNSSVEKLPVTGSVSLPKVANTEAFVPDHMDDPKIYPGDVMVGVKNGEINFGELVVDRADDAVITVPLKKGTPRFVPDNIFTARIYQSDEIHIYEGVGSVIEESDVEFDVSKLTTPEERDRPR